MDRAIHPTYVIEATFIKLSYYACPKMGVYMRYFYPLLRLLSKIETLVQ